MATTYYSVGAVTLTTREMQILSLLILANSKKMIADALGIAFGTVKTEEDRLFKKLNVHSASEAIIYALRNGFDVDGKVDGKDYKAF